MTQALSKRLYDELSRIRLIDPHSHINPHAAAAKTLGDILGYHYYTELAHSAGMPRERIEEPGISPKEKVARLVAKLPELENTIQYSWLIEMCQVFFDFDYETVTDQNWERLYDRAATKMALPDWEDQVLERSGLDAVFLTNDFDDPLTGFDTKRYIPCLRTDDLVFHFGKPETRQRLESASGISVTNVTTLRDAIGKLFDHFKKNGCRACAISLPPDFSPQPVDELTADRVLQGVLGGRVSLEPSVLEIHQVSSSRTGGRSLSAEEATTLSRFIFWTLAEFCVEFKLPFDLMIGVNRRVYEAGVYQGQDLFDQRTSLIQYRRLFNAFPQVTFPISVLSHAANQELVSYSWIFPNVVTNGHWWYSNIPVYIELDTRARLQAVPQTKQIGYYSDMYKLEFALPKFAMYRRVLADILANDFVVARRWPEERALQLGHLVLRGNVEQIFSC